MQRNSGGGEFPLKVRPPQYLNVQAVEEAFQELRVGVVSAASGRGRHTTRNVSLLRVPGGSGRLADTPGFSQPSLAKVTSTSLSDLFPEVCCSSCSRRKPFSVCFLLSKQLFCSETSCSSIY